MVRVAAAIFAALLLWQCNGEGETTPAEADCAAAVTAFTTNIQPHVKTNSCDQSGCHSSATDTGGFAMKAGESNVTSNRRGMLHEVEEHDLLDGNKLWTYLTGEHPGKDQLGGLTETKVTAWVTAEQACN